MGNKSSAIREKLRAHALCVIYEEKRGMRGIGHDTGDSARRHHVKDILHDGPVHDEVVMNVVDTG